MSQDLFSQFNMQQVSSELISPTIRFKNSRKLNTREKKAVKCLLDEDEKQDPYINSSILEEFQRNIKEQNKRKMIEKPLNRNLSPVSSRANYPKMIKNHSMKQETRKHFDVTKRMNISYKRDFEQQTVQKQIQNEELQNILEVQRFQQRFNQQTLHLNPCNLKLPNQQDRYQQNTAEETLLNFDIRGSKNLKIRQLLIKMNKQKSLSSHPKRVPNYQNQPVNNNELPCFFESIHQIKKRRLPKDIKLNNKSYDQSLYSTQVFFKDRQKKQQKVKSPLKLPLYKNGIKFKKLQESEGTIVGIKLT